MKIVLLDRRSLGTDLPLAPLERFAEPVVYETTSPVEAPERLVEAEVLVINKFRMTEAMFAAAPKLRLICEFATGFDNIDLAAARRRGVAVCNVPAYSTESVALFTAATALALVTHLGEYRRFTASGAYTAAGEANRLEPVYHELTGKTWGVLGCGAIGGRVAQIARALGMEILVHQRREHPLYPTVSLDELCVKSDILSIHCPLNESTRGLLDARRLALMKPTAILINEARGAVTDEAAVAEAILSGGIAGFGSDVYASEPFGREHPFQRIKDRDNVILTPHTAWSAYEARVRCLDVIVGNIEDFLAGGTRNRVD